MITVVNLIEHKRAHWVIWHLKILVNARKMDMYVLSVMKTTAVETKIPRHVVVFHVMKQDIKNQMNRCILILETVISRLKKVDLHD